MTDGETDKLTTSQAMDASAKAQWDKWFPCSRCTEKRAPGVKLPSGERTCHVLQNRGMFLWLVVPAFVTACILVVRAHSDLLPESQVKLAVLHFGFYASLFWLMWAFIAELNEASHWAISAHFEDKTVEARNRHVRTAIYGIIGSAATLLGLIFAIQYTSAGTQWEAYASSGSFLVGAAFLGGALINSNHPFDLVLYELKKERDMQIFSSAGSYKIGQIRMCILMAILGGGGVLLFLKKQGTVSWLDDVDELYAGYIEIIVVLSVFWGSSLHELKSNLDYYANSKKKPEVKWCGCNTGPVGYVFSRPSTHWLIGLGGVIASLYMFAFIADHPSWLNSPVTAASLLIGGCFFVITGVMTSRRFFDNDHTTGESCKAVWWAFCCCGAKACCADERDFRANSGSTEERVVEVGETPSTSESMG